MGENVWEKLDVGQLCHTVLHLLSPRHKPRPLIPVCFGVLQWLECE